MGKDSSCAPNHKCADLWRQVWVAIDDFGLDSFTLQKVSSHTPLRQVQDGTAAISFWDWAGNNAADKAAKKGAKQHPKDEHVSSALTNVRTFTREIGIWLGQLGAHLVKLKSPDVQERSQPMALTRQFMIVDVPGD